MKSPYFYPHHKKVVFFDLNRTLIDHKQSFRKCFVEVLEEFTARWDREGIDWQPEALASRYMRMYKKIRLKNGTKPSLFKRQSTALRTILKPYPLVVNDEFIRSFFKRMKQLRPQCEQLHEEAQTVLASLKPTYRLGLISNNEHTDLGKLGLSSFFTSKQLITPQRSGYHKPHPAMFRYAMRTFAAKPQQCVMIGDSWKRDIIGASRAGMDAVWLNPKAKAITSKRKVHTRTVITASRLDLIPRLFKIQAH